MKVGGGVVKQSSGFPLQQKAFMVYDLGLNQEELEGGMKSVWFRSFRTWTLVFMGVGMCLWGTVGLAGVVEDAPEAAEYTLVYELPIPDTGAFNYNPVPYSFDDSGALDFSFDRVAYHLELQKPGEERFFVYVSMPAQVLESTEVGVPTTGSGVVIQEVVQSVRVLSNHPDLAGVPQDIEASVEFWPFNYVPNNGSGVPGATSEHYDSGDQPAGDGDYGSMQIHQAGTNKTLFALNCWGGGYGVFDLGIGNTPGTESGGNSDWTFSANADQYTLKTLRVLVRSGEPIAGLSADVTSPDSHQVIQRRPGNTAVVPVTGTMKVSADQVDARVIPLTKEGSPAGDPTGWTMVDAGPIGTTFAGEMEVAAGWYRMELRVWKDGEVLDTLEVEPFGVGEVFLTAGQSNSANSGEAPISPTDPGVRAGGRGGWQWGVEPQPIATGTGGTPWPVLGDLLAERFDVPIGFVSIGWGGTSVAQWLPFASDGLYQRFILAFGELGVGGARAVLWHQGESDAYAQTSTQLYADRLQEVIAATRADGGWEIPWGVARASFLPNLPQASMDAVVAGQDQVIAQDPLTFAGPNTDDLIGEEWRWDTVHFTVAGLEEHAKRWNAVIELPACQGFFAEEDCPGEEETDVVSESDTSEESDAGVEEDGGEPDAGGTDPEDVAGEDGSAEEALDVPIVDSEGGASPDVFNPSHSEVWILQDEVPGEEEAESSVGGSGAVTLAAGTTDDGCASGAGAPGSLPLWIGILGMVLAVRRRQLV